MQTIFKSLVKMIFGVRLGLAAFLASFHDESLMSESGGCVAGSDSICFSPAKGSHTSILSDDLAKGLGGLEEPNPLVEVVEVFAYRVAHPVGEASLDGSVLSRPAGIVIANNESAW